MFTDRYDAGKKLASYLTAYKNQPNTLILALPRGGVPVAYQVAHILKLPLEVFIVRKLGVPFHKETAMGAIASDGIVLVNKELIEKLNISHATVQHIIDEETSELHRRETLYRHKKFPDLHGKTLILIDDGLATGFTALAAIHALRKYHPAQIIFATPVGASTVCNDLRKHADQVVCVYTPDPFYAVGQAYKDFAQTSAEEVNSLLKQAGDEVYHYE